MSRWATVSVVAALIVLTGTVPAQARAEDPPNVIGLSISDSRSELRKWNKAVVIAYVPALESLPAGVDPASVVDPALTVRLGQGIALLDEERKPSNA